MLNKSLKNSKFVNFYLQKAGKEINMDKIIECLQGLNPISIAVRLVFCVLIGGLLGIERGKQGRAAGMRTHILVCIGAALVAMIGIYVTNLSDVGGDPMRIAAQVVSGIGFLGVGTILIKGRFQITGLTTAAGLWTVAAIGLALGFGFYEGALIAFACIGLTVTVAHKLEYLIYKKYRRFGIYLEIRSDKDIRRTIEFMESKFTVNDIQVTSPRSGIAGNIGVEANVFNKDGKTTPELVAQTLETAEQVAFALESI